MNKNRSVALIREITAGYSAPDSSVRGVAVLSGDNRLKVSLINLAPVSGGKYRVAACDGDFGDFESVPLDSLSSAELTVSGENVGVTVALCSDDGQRIIPIAYGAFSSRARSAKEMTDYAKNARYESPYGVATEKPDAKNADYDDEVVATEDYYAYERERRRTENIDYENFGGDENVGNESAAYGYEKAKIAGVDTFGDETQSARDEIYFDKIKPQIERLFKDFPSEENLNEVVPDGKWVKIDYDETEHYCVGVIYENGKPSYLCYGVPGRYGEKPEKLSGDCRFIPSSLFRLKGDGYWVLFQDAVTGECV